MKRCSTSCSTRGGGLCGCCLVALIIIASAAASPTQAEPMRVAYFHRQGLDPDGTILQRTREMLLEGNWVHLTDFQYRDANEFCELYRRHVSDATEPFDLVLGPSDSASLKALDMTLSARQTIPFLAPFITTPPREYRNVHLVSASPSDSDRVFEANRQFVRYVAPRALAVVHRDDVWGQQIARHFRARLGPGRIVVHDLPVDEPGNGGNGAAASVEPTTHDQYRRFLATLRSAGVPVVVVAFFKNASVNDFLDALAEFNRDLCIKYTPSILLLNEPRFHHNNRTLGVLDFHLRNYNVLHVGEPISTATDTNAPTDGLTAAHLDACRVVAAAAQLGSASSPGTGGPHPGVWRTLDFYGGDWPAAHVDRLQGELLTAFHRKALGLTPPILEVIWNRLNDGGRQPEPAADYFGSNYAQQLASRAWFFMLHNRGLWHWLTVLGFVLASFASFVSVVEMKAMKPFWLLLRARAFWKLFAINFGLTYLAWILAVYWGIIEDSNWMAILALAAVCPTAAGAYGDMFKRYMPAGLSGIIRILEELSERLLERVNQSQLHDYKAWLTQFPLEQIKHAFYDLLFGELKNEALRSRVLDRTKMHLDAMAGEEAGDTLDQAAKTVYINAYLTVLSYLSSGEDDLWRQLQENGFTPDAPPPQIPLAS